MSHADIKEYEALVRRLKTLSVAQTVFLKVHLYLRTHLRSCKSLILRC